MNPEDERSMLVWSFVEAVKIVKPRAFVMENVKALAALSRWEDFRHKLMSAFAELGYSLSMRVLNATEYGVPQKRERMFLVGLRDGHINNFDSVLHQHKKKAATVRQALKHLDSAGTGNNQRVCNAEITLASNPILRKSPYAGMMFNGAGRPIHIDGYALTLPASMGGNKTPIIDNLLLENADAEDWVVQYHTHLMAGGEPYPWKDVPSYLRRITVDEALALQTFPASFKLAGGKSAAYRMIGNAVSCNLAYAVAKTVKCYLQEEQDIAPSVYSKSTVELRSELAL
jgi:DNA (cytosine-5)-methyltransferase 1